MKIRNTPRNIRNISIVVLLGIIITCCILMHIDYYLLYHNPIFKVIMLVAFSVYWIIDFFCVRCNYCGIYLKIALWDNFCPHCSMSIDVTPKEAHEHKVKIENEKGKELTEKYFE